MAKLFIEDLNVQGKKVLMRVDFNVPLDEDLNVTDDTRIQETLPSIKYVLKNNGRLILMSHLGRPNNAFVPELSLKPVAKALSALLNLPMKMAPDCIGMHVQEMVDMLKPGEILLLENLRFHRAEEHPEEDVSFAKELASFGDFYVNDAFGTAHRKHSSTYTVAKFFPGKAAAGYLLEKEIRFLGNALTQPKRPFYALIGGAKISTKIGVIKSLLQKVDALLLGGGMAYTFLKAKNVSIGNSLVEEELVPLAEELLRVSEQKKVPILLPQDFIAVQKLDDDAPLKLCDIQKGIPQDYQGADIGPKTIELFSQTLQKAATILWNGPMGVFEIENLAKGTMSIAMAIAQSKAMSIVGGGDSIAAINQMELADRFTHLSTGGGATLEFIEFGTLPGVEVLSEKKSFSHT